MLALLLLGSGGWILWKDGPAQVTQIVDGGAATERSNRPTGTRTVDVYATPGTPATATPKPTPTQPPTKKLSPTVTSTSSVTPTPPETSTPVSLPSATPDTPDAETPTPYLSQYRLVTYYGSPLGPQLGILGTLPRHLLAERLRQIAAQYQALSPQRRVLPAFHIITTVADAYPGELGRYSHQLSLEIIADWVATARGANTAVILDVQPGYASIEEEFRRIQYFLYSPHVHLALDSEFAMEDGQVPGLTLGQIYAWEINQIQAHLNDIAKEIGTNKVLMVHQFEGHMVPDKSAIENYPYVELVFDADGFGSPEAKKEDYGQYASEPAFEYGGFKLFLDWDYPLMSPSQVMALDPPPMVIIYQ